MSKPTILHIASPCHEEWNSMTQAQQGKFCSLCQKAVVDFTNMTDEQVLAFFRKPSRDAICGRMNRGQLGRPMLVPRKRFPWIKYFFHFAIPAMLASVRGEAQEKQKPVAKAESSVKEKEPYVLGNTVCMIDRSIRVKGKIVDEFGDPIAGSSVMVNGTSYSTATDTLGNFSLKFKGESDEYVLECSAIGYENTEYVIRDSVDDLEISLVASSLGEIVYLGAIAIVDKLPTIEANVDTAMPVKAISPVRRLVNELKFSCYPNPVKSNALLNVVFEQGEKGAYLVEIISLTGQIIQGKEYWLENGNQSLSMPVPGLARGLYYVRVRNKSGKIFVTEKILID
jgi:hypothetical protein